MKNALFYWCLYIVDQMIVSLNNSIDFGRYYLRIITLEWKIITLKKGGVMKSIFEKFLRKRPRYRKKTRFNLCNPLKQQQQPKLAHLI